MNFKIDTKEAFHVISLNTTQFTAKLAEEISAEISKKQDQNKKSLVFNLDNLTSIEQAAVIAVENLYEKTIHDNKSFVLCCLTPDIKDAFSRNNMLEKINHTPSESEAWDIVQMEEIERELNNELE